MKRPRRHRGLTEGEARLWGEIAKLITPLRGRAVPKAKVAAKPPAASSEPTAAAKSSVATKAKAVLAKSTSKSMNAPAQPPLSPAVIGRAPHPSRQKRPLKLTDLGMATPVASHSVPRVALPPAADPGVPGLERRERRGLQRGLLPIEARIDLHGLYQAEAHAALVGFLMRSRAAGHARVLVVTGKGKAGAEDGVSERGVLRRHVPHWLRGAELRTVVLGFEEAARHHGGQGALYVRLRRR